MCGIAGIFKFKGPPIDNEDILILKKMGYRLRNRGPDDEKIMQDGGEVAFLFRRLSIIDLEGGEQPMSDPIHQNFLMVNGEIYNYKHIKSVLEPNYPFKSQSDCEVVLPLYLKNGLEFTKDMTGMFAIALWDKQKKRLILTRDHLGIKPLFYTVTKKGHLLFTSEIKALLAHPDCIRELDWEKNISDMMLRGTVKGTANSGYKGIEIVPPGSHVIINQADETIQIKKWWSFTFPSDEELKKDTRTELEVIEGYRKLLQESVEMQLMSDVEVAIALSGGIDSISISALASQIKPLKTFTILNLSTFQNDDARGANIASKYLGVPNYDLYFPWQTNSFTYPFLKEVLWACEMPLDPEHLLKYMLYRKIKENFPNIKTVLIGQGSDEFNGGYCHQWISGYLPELKDEQHNWNAFMNASEKNKKQNQLLSTNPFLLSHTLHLNRDFIDSLEGFQKLDPWQYYQMRHTNTITSYNLWHEDRTSAANKLENRVPFLDHRIVEYLAKVPKHLRQGLFWEKRILREAIAPFLPKEISQRPKVPFFYGKGERYTFRMMHNLLSANNYEFLRESLLENPIVKDIFDLDYIHNNFKALSACPSYVGTEETIRLASLGLLAKWAKENNEIEKEPIEKLNIDWLNIQDWEAEKEELAVLMGTHKNPLTEQSVLAFGETVKLLHDARGLMSYILVEGEVKYTIDPAVYKNYLNFLNHIDGKKTIGTLLKELNITLGEIIADIDEDIESDILVDVGVHGNNHKASTEFSQSSTSQSPL